jgi:hypothetical protein
VRCEPNTPGLSDAVVTVRDSFGDQTSSVPVVLVVAPPLNVSVVASARGVDVGGSLSFAAAISGGTPPYACTWTLPGGFPTPGNCSGSMRTPLTSAGSVNASLSVVDATGAVANATSATVHVAGTLVVFLARSTNDTSANVGSPTTFTVAVTGGTAPVSLTWYEGTAVVAGFNGSSITLTPNATGDLSVSVTAVDGGGATVRSNVVTLSVGAATGGGNGTGPSSTPAPNPYGATFWAAVGLAALAAVEAVLLLATRRPRAPRRPPPPEAV